METGPCTLEQKISLPFTCLKGKENAIGIHKNGSSSFCILILQWQGGFSCLEFFIWTIAFQVRSIAGWLMGLTVKILVWDAPLAVVHLERRNSRIFKDNYDSFEFCVSQFLSEVTITSNTFVTISLSKTFNDWKGPYSLVFLLGKVSLTLALKLSTFVLVKTIICFLLRKKKVS